MKKDFSGSTRMEMKAGNRTKTRYFLKSIEIHAVNFRGDKFVFTQDQCLAE